MGVLLSAPDEARSVAEKPEDPCKGQNAPKHKTECLLDHHPPGLFNAHWTPLYERLTVGSMAAIQRARAMFSAPLARAMLST